MDVFAGTAAVGRVASLIVPDEARIGDDGGWFSSGAGDGVRFNDDLDGRGRPGRAQQFRDPDDVSIRDTVRSGLIALPAGLIFLFHWRRRRQLVAEDGFEGSPAWRADRAYLYVSCLIAAIAGAFAAGNTVFDVFRVLAPSVSAGAGPTFERRRAAADFITMSTLTLAALVVFCWHWGLVSGEGNPLRRLRQRLPRRSGDG